MKKIFPKLKKSILFYTTLYILILLVSKFIFNIFNMEYIGWVYNISYYLFFLGILLGIIQLIIKLKLSKVMKIVIISTLILLYGSAFIILSYILSLCDVFPNEKVIDSPNGTKIVVSHKNLLLHGSHTQYKYYNFIIRGKKAILYYSY